MCKYCNMLFCINHRFPEDHKCQVEKTIQMEEVKQSDQVKGAKQAILDKIKERSQSKTEKTPIKNGGKTAKKVEIMKVKGKCKGDKNLSVEHRFAMKIHLLDQEEPLLLFFDDRMKVGRMVDQLCEQYKIQHTIDPDRREETMLRMMWDDTLVEIDMQITLREIT